MAFLWIFQKRYRSKLSYDTISAGYDSLEPYGGYDKFYHNTAMRLGSLEGKVLDIGCGYGKLLQTLKVHNPDKKLDLYGIDICTKAVESCKKSGIHAEYGNAENLPYPAEYFDLIIMNTVIEHIIDQGRALNEANRVLKKNGMFLLVTENLWWQLVTAIKNVILFWKPKYQRRKQPIDDEFTYRRLKKLLKKTGFVIVRREQSGSIALLERYLRHFTWSIAFAKRHWLLCKKMTVFGSVFIIQMLSFHCGDIFIIPLLCNIFDDISSLK